MTIYKVQKGTLKSFDTTARSLTIRTLENKKEAYTWLSEFEKEEGRVWDWEEALAKKMNDEIVLKLRDGKIYAIDRDLSSRQL